MEQQINARGGISVYGRNDDVGRRYVGRASFVRFGAETGVWLFELADGPVIGRYPAGLDLNTILARQVRSRHCGKTPVAPDGKN